MTVAIIVILAVLASITADVCVLSWWIKRLRVEAVESLRETVDGEKVYHVEDCNYFGTLSRGYAQLRGNGILALTDRGIHFRMLLPRRYLFIPLASVRAVSRPRSFLGKTRAGELLRVDFADDEGREDACAWLVPSPEWWTEALHALRAGGEPPTVPPPRA
ncbi:MAG: hypothetical protein H5T73_05520 [Actinobacteria bacterium]|nr:hypothetical protein [Actinomycetota bacterium]